MNAKSVHNIFHNLSACMDKAEMLELIRKNPCRNITLPKYIKKETSVYDEQEVQALVKAIKDTELELPIMIDLSLGLRRGELLALKWKHIDFENCIMSIEENLVETRENGKNKVVTKAPKSKSGIRKLPL